MYIICKKNNNNVSEYLSENLIFLLDHQENISGGMSITLMEMRGI